MGPLLQKIKCSYEYGSEVIDAMLESGELVMLEGRSKNDNKRCTVYRRSRHGVRGEL